MSHDAVYDGGLDMSPTIYVLLVILALHMENASVIFWPRLTQCFHIDGHAHRPYSHHAPRGGRFRRGPAMHQQRNLRVVQHQGGLLRAGPALGSRAKLTVR
ncbi:LOW QUALITY PROTEIN: hypothetical protein H101_02218 [Trichophyton interdigitale H6]|nr:LOW QUALITY PROTEIN: hypothetical protein H101_02218 [Trichophyton interdigitale H6]